MNSIQSKKHNNNDSIISDALELLFNDLSIFVKYYSFELKSEKATFPKTTITVN